MNKLRLMANLPLYVDNIPIYSPTLREIANIGLDQYKSILTYCTITKDSMIDKNSITNNYDALLKLLSFDENYLPIFICSLNFVTKIEFIPIFENGKIAFAKDDKIINKNNYDNLVNAIKFSNKLEINCEAELDEFDKRCLAMEKKIQEQQNRDIEQPDFEDLISAVANFDGNGLNIINIWDLNIYQFYEQFERGQLKENYRLNIQQLLAGAKPDDIKLESYLKKIVN